MPDRGGTRDGDRAIASLEDFGLEPRRDLVRTRTLHERTRYCSDRVGRCPSSQLDRGVQQVVDPHAGRAIRDAPFARSQVGRVDHDIAYFDE